MKKILIVEDEKALANVLSLKLTKSGFDVDVAINGDIAVEMLGNKKYDLLVLDLILPLMDGFGVLKAIKNMDLVDMPIIVVSNLSSQEDKRRAEYLGADEFIVKSDTSMAEILEKINQLIK